MQAPVSNWRLQMAIVGIEKYCVVSVFERAIPGLRAQKIKRVRAQGRRKHPSSWPRSALLTLSSTLRPVSGSTDRRSERRTASAIQRHTLRGSSCSRVHG